MKKIITEDGSVTFRNKKFDETYHSKSGGEEEAIKKHAEPLKVWEKNSPVIYDICFGLGYNSAAAIDLINAKNKNAKITVYCFENDEEILKKILEINTNFKSYPIITNFIKNFLETKKRHSIKDNEESFIYEKYYESRNLTLKMFFGDVKKRIDEPPLSADFIFFDPFSPKKHPEMWTLKFIKYVYNKTSRGGKLSTYSYARMVRDNFKKAKFEVIDGPTIGRRCPSTIAIKY